MAHPSHTGWRWRSPAGIALLVFLGIATFFLVTEHLAHLITVLPWLFLLLCPLMHLLMHGAHGSHGGHGGHGGHGSHGGHNGQNNNSEGGQS